MKKKNRKRSKTPQKKTKVLTPAAIIAATMGAGVFAVGIAGVSNGRTGGFYLILLSLIFFSAIGIGVLKK